MIHSWFTSSVFQYALGVPALEPQASDSSEEANRMQRFLSTQVGSAILSSEVWDAVGEVSTAVTFHLQHQAQGMGREAMDGELSTCQPPLRRSVQFTLQLLPVPLGEAK
ncbi:Hypothetical predicted protein [Marmota monax]|uniref:Uncharacterized protein n=1 Tax=Marmota monax TaxID=9995 RepID=A0A5E4AG49_MARMO|nr:Hypothetical predicted protein [Marmota monax]